MEKETPLYQIIYNKIVDRILVGVYRKGDRLPSEQKMHAQYQVGYTSIRHAMRMLQRDGFILSEERKSPVVLFDSCDPAAIKLRERFFIQRCDAHLDCCKALPHIIPGIAGMGAARYDDALLDALDAMTAVPTARFTLRSDLPTYIHSFIRLLICQSGNGLAEDLFFQCLGFDRLRLIVLPGGELLPGEAENALAFLRHLTSLIRQKDFVELHTLLYFYFQQNYFSLARLYEPIKRDALEEPPVEFAWNVRQAPTPLYRKVAYDLLRTAQADGLVSGDYFPSEAALVRQYDVAVVTIRKALALLASMGFAQTVNGVGTRFITEQQYSSQRNACLKEYFEALEIFSACSRALAYPLCDAFTPRDVARLRKGVTACKTRNVLLVWLLGQLLDAVPVHALGNIFGQLQSRMIFGLFISDPKRGRGQQAYLELMHRKVMDCLDALESRKADELSARFAELFDATYRSSQARLAELQGS